MAKIEHIRELAASLTDQEVRELAAWFDKPQAELWDAQIARDAEAGKLDEVAEAALADHRAGRTRPL